MENLPRCSHSVRRASACSCGHFPHLRVKTLLTSLCMCMYFYAVEGIKFHVMASVKTFRQGQILRLINSERIANQEDLRRRLSLQKLRVTQATLSRDLQELKLVKTPEGYRQATALVEEIAPMPPLARA